MSAKEGLVGGQKNSQNIVNVVCERPLLLSKRQNKCDFFFNFVSFSPYHVLTLHPEPTQKWWLEMVNWQRCIHYYMTSLVIHTLDWLEGPELKSVLSKLFFKPIYILLRPIVDRGLSYAKKGPSTAKNGHTLQQLKDEWWDAGENPRLQPYIYRIPLTLMKLQSIVNSSYQNGLKLIMKVHTYSIF